MNVFEKFSGKKVLILGFGVEGQSTLRLIKESGVSMDLTVADKSKIDIDGVSVKYGDTYNYGLDDFDVIIKSPGVPMFEVQTRAFITSQTNLFLEVARHKTIGVTGTKGKGTTSTIIHSILKSAGLRTELLGNIGTPALEGLKTLDWYVFEMSAQQLQTSSLSPHIAVALKVVPDHLDHFVTKEAYIGSKQNIVRYQSEDDIFIGNDAAQFPRECASLTKARKVWCSTMPNDSCLVYVKDHYVCSNGQRIISCEEVATVFPGAFNLDNVTAAAAVGCYLNLDYGAIREGILNAKPLKYRFDNVGTFNGITFINASISTVPEVTIAHLRAFPGKIGALICGGFDRGVEQETLAKEIVELKIPFVVLFPTTGDLIKAKILENGGYIPTMYQVTSRTGKECIEEAISEIFKETAPGTVCLHSPGAASFGLFKDYKERGRLFEEAVLSQS